MDITWGILAVAFGAGFFCCLVISILGYFYARSRIAPVAKELQDENERLRIAVKGYEEAFTKMKITPPSV